MKTNFYPFLWSLLIGSLSSHWASAQLMYGGSTTEDSIWGIDTTTWTISQRRQLSMPGYAILGTYGLAGDPISHETYALLNVSVFPNASMLVRVNLATGTCTPVGSLNARVSSITFRADGQLMGVVGDNGGAMAEQLFLIDKTTASTTLATPLGNGDSGEVISYNPLDAMLYHWSGNASMVWEKLPASSPYSPVTNLPTSGSPGGEVVGAISLGNHRFLVSSTGQSIRHLSGAGQYGNTLITTPTPLTGLVLPPQFTLSDATICLDETLNWDMKGIALDTAVYIWGDGHTTTVFPAGPATHSYAAPGNYSGFVGLKNSVVGLDTFASAFIRVNQLPPVSLFPSQDTLLCVEDTLLITGSFGGTSRWYRNGILIPGANTNQYYATQNGHYNMTKTNMNGCTDSAATGIKVTFANHVPTPSITYDDSNCPTIVFMHNDPYGTAWHWTFGDGGSSTASNPIHTYGAVGTYPLQVVATNGCYTDTAASSITISCPISADPAIIHAFSAHPNPSNGTFRLQGRIASPGEIHYCIHDLRGRILLDKKIVSTQPEWMDTVHLGEGAGIYLLTLDMGHTTRHLRLVIQ